MFVTIGMCKPTVMEEQAASEHDIKFTLQLSVCLRWRFGENGSHSGS